MPIRKRSQATYTEAVDNVINERVFDERGTFDPKKSPFAGSIVERLVGADATPEQMRSVIKGVSFSVAHSGNQHGPTSLRTQDTLALTRLMDNPGWQTEMTYRNRVRSPLTGIRGFCVVTCKSGSPKAVSHCSNIGCPLWAFRMGKNGLR